MHWFREGIRRGVGLSLQIPPLTTFNVIWSPLPPIQCHQDSLNWGGGEGRHFIRVKWLKWNSPSLAVRSSATAPVQQLWCYSLSRKRSWKGTPRRQRRGWHIEREVPAPRVRWSISLQRTPNPHSLIDPNSTVLIGWLHAFWLVVVELLWFVNEDANEDTAAQLLTGWGRSQRIGQNTIPGSPL